MRVRYDRWSGMQDPFPADVSADVVLDEISDELLAGSGLDEALGRLAERGMRGRFSGLEQLRRRVEEARRRELSRIGLEGPLEQVRERLADIVGRERDAAADDDSERGAARRSALDRLPADPAGQIGALRGHDWADADARGDFEALLAELQADVARATFGRLASALAGADEAALARLRDFLAELNDLADAAARGEDVDEAWERFRQRYGGELGALGHPETLDDLLAELARRQAAMSRMLAGLDAAQRDELARLAAEALGDVGLSFEADRLRRTLEQRFPRLGWGEPVPGAPPIGPVDGSLADTVDWVERLQEYEDLAEALRQDYPGARLEDIDEATLASALDDEAVRDLRALREIERALEQAGAAGRQHGRLELTPRGIRRLGEAALARLYERALGTAAGSHPLPDVGGDGEPVGTTRQLRYGDPFRVDVNRTVRNAVLRQAGPRAAAGTAAVGERAPGGVQVAAEDFELVEAERRIRGLTVLLLDMSFSMPLRGNWLPAKRVALALQALVASKYPEDRFAIVGFSDYARELQPRDLLVAGWERVYGTNMEHAFQITRRLFAAHPAADKQVIMITDGEPTAHLEGAEARFAWPPEPVTLKRTMREAARLARTGATMNVFLLDHDPGAAAFIERMVSCYGGRIFYPDLGDLGHLVVRDFLRRRR